MVFGFYFPGGDKPYKSAPHIYFSTDVAKMQAWVNAGPACPGSEGSRRWASLDQARGESMRQVRLDIGGAYLLNLDADGDSVDAGWVFEQAGKEASKGEVAREVARLGLWMETSNPGDGVTRYKFYTAKQNDGSRPVGRALGKKEALTWLKGWCCAAEFYGAEGV